MCNAVCDIYLTIFIYLRNILADANSMQILQCVVFTVSWKTKQNSMLVLTSTVLFLQYLKTKLWRPLFPKHRDNHSLNHVLLTKPLNWKTIFTPQSKRLSNNHINLPAPIPQNNYSVTILMICERCGVKKWKSSHSEVLAIQIVTPDKSAMIY